MKIEHFAFNVAEPAAVAEWYVRYLGLTVARRLNNKQQTHFLADESGFILIEIYNNPPNQIPPYAAMNPLLLHLAFVSENPDSDRVALVEAGASFVEEEHFADGTHLVMLRDPWGLALQLCKRGVPMLKSV